ncbi:UNVERIFIED_ORG: hypothetical protein ABIC43_004859 [Variovorax guangxiensis]
MSVALNDPEPHAPTCAERAGVKPYVFAEVLAKGGVEALR